MEHVVHTFPPVFDARSRVLIVGSLPSVKSREEGFYYGNPHNRFFRVVSTLLRMPLPQSNEEKRELLLAGRIAVFDAIAECDIMGSSDASIKNARPNDFSMIFEIADIRQVFANGALAHKYYTKYVGGAVRLPSTSPANAAYSLERLVGAWSVVCPYLDEA